MKHEKYISQLREKHNLPIEFEMDLCGAAMLYILKHQNRPDKGKHANAIRGLNKIKNYLAKINDEYLKLSKENRAINSHIHKEMEILESLSNEHGSLIDNVDTSKKDFNELKENISEIFKTYNVPYSNTYNDYDPTNNETYQLLEAIRESVGIKDSFNHRL